MFSFYIEAVHLDKIFDIFDLFQAFAMAIVLRMFCYRRAFKTIFLVYSFIFAFVEPIWILFSFTASYKLSTFYFITSRL